MRIDADGSRAGKNCSTVANTTIYSTDFNTDFPVLQLFPESEPTASGTYFKPEKWRAREKRFIIVNICLCTTEKSLFCVERQSVLIYLHIFLISTD